MQSWILPMAVGALAALGGRALTLAPVEDPPAEETAAEREERKLRALFEAMKQREIMEASTRVSAEAFTEMGLPETFTEEFLDRFDYDRIISGTLERYVAHFEEETIDALLAFYASEQGKVYAEAMPELTVELIRLGQAYGKELALEIAGQGR